MEHYTEIPLSNNTSKHQFEMEIEGFTAFISYKIWDNRVTLMHTEIPYQLEGKGVAMALVKKVLLHIESLHYKLIPLCPVVLLFLQKNPEWLRIVDTDASTKLGIKIDRP